MELSKEYRSRIEEIVKGFRCPKDFRCTKSGVDAICEAEDIGFESILLCSDDNKEPCKFKVYTGDFRFCTCPMRNYIAKNIHN